MARYLFNNSSWKYFCKKVEKAKRIEVFLDYDGTITPIRKTPHLAVISKRNFNLINALSTSSKVSVSIVTGRAMEDIQKLIPIKKGTFIANHGLHIIHNGKTWIHPIAKLTERRLKILSKTLMKLVRPFQRAQLENKKYTLSIHYRQVPLKKTTDLINLVKIASIIFDPSLIITDGKKIIEIRPPIKWGKGDAVLKILSDNKTPSLAICFGDDTTDEDVFKKLKHKAITVKVGEEKSTYAKYYTRNVNEVIRILKYIYHTKQ